MDQGNQRQLSKREQIEEFMSKLDIYAKKVAADAVGRAANSCQIYHIPKAKEELVNSLYTLFDVGKVEDDRY